MGPGEFEGGFIRMPLSLSELGTRMQLASFAYANDILEGEDHPGQY